MIGAQIFAQNYCIPQRFTDSYYFRSKDIQHDKDIVYGKAVDYKGNIKILDLDIFYPKKSVDSTGKKPLIMLVHGGGGNKTSMYKYCPLFAERGFVVATISCRTQINKDEISSLKGAYQTLQDAHAALRFLIYNANKYEIDTNAVFAGGQSAGALTSTALAYMVQQDFDNRYPDVTKSIGSMDNATNDLTTRFTIRGVIDMWGQIPDTSFISIEEANNIPIIMFHGTADSSLSPYIKSVQISKRFKNLGGCYQLHTKTGAGHGELMSKYYIAAETSCFIKRILCGSCISLEREIDNESFDCNNPLPIDAVPVERTGIRVDQTLFTQYTGKYIFVDDDRKKQTLQIFYQGEHLILEFIEGGFKTELLPESEDNFFMKDDNAQISFNKNKNGRIDKLTLFIDAKEIDAKLRRLTSSKETGPR